jgi:hypothetical protein
VRPTHPDKVHLFVVQPRKRQIVVRLVGGVDVGKTALTLALKEIDATLNNRACAEWLSSTPPTGSRYLIYPDIDWQRRRGLLQEARDEWPSSYWNSLYADQWRIAADYIETPETIFCLLQQSRMSSPHITPNFDITLWVRTHTLLYVQLLWATCD